MPTKPKKPDRVGARAGDHIAFIPIMGSFAVGILEAGDPKKLAKLDEGRQFFVLEFLRTPENCRHFARSAIAFAGLRINPEEHKLERGFSYELVEQE